MLTTAQIEYVDRSFGLYDHDWCFYAEFPYFNFLRGLDVWGRYESYAEPLVLCGRTFDLVQDYGEFTMTDVMMDVLFFDFETQGEARRARNSAKNKGLVTSVTQPCLLCHEHNSLMMKFFATHAVSAVHASFYLALTSLIKNPNIFIDEARHEERLKGYAVLSLPNPSVVSMLMGFYDNTSGLRVSDGVYGQMIDWAKTRGMERLHFGYSATDSLSEYKKKWNANLSGPTYREAIFASDAILVASLKRGVTAWRDRIYLSVLEKSPVD